MRRGELLSLRRGNVDFERGLIHCDDCDAQTWRVDVSNRIPLCLKENKREPYDFRLAPSRFTKRLVQVSFHDF